MEEDYIRCKICNKLYLEYFYDTHVKSHTYISYF